jgi:type IV pilus assembly protein PilZ
MSTGPRQGILPCIIKEKNALYAAYMPFVKNGGLFVPTDRPYKLGDEVFMVLTLMNDSERLPVAGKVVWITPRGAEGNRTHGVGIQFSEQDGGGTRNKIETYLAGIVNSDKPTHTM